MISCGGGVGRIRSWGAQLWAIPGVVWNHRGGRLVAKAVSPNPGKTGWRALVRRPRLRLKKETVRLLR